MGCCVSVVGQKTPKVLGTIYIGELNNFWQLVTLFLVMACDG